MKMTRAAETSTHTVSALLMVGAGGASAAAGSAAGAAASVATAAAGVVVASAVATAGASGGVSAAGAAAVSTGAGADAAGSCANVGKEVIAATPHSAASSRDWTRVFHPEERGIFMGGSVVWLERIGADLAGADADDMLERDDENLAVADLAGAGGLADRLQRGIEHLVADRGLDLQLRQEVDDVLGA